MDMDLEDVDDETFLRGLKQKNIEDLQRRVDETEKNCLESTRRSLRSLAETEKIGVTASEELVRNREQLTNVTKSLNNISSDLKKSQKHIDSIRSVFSTLKNSLFKRKSAEKKMDTIHEEIEDDKERPLDKYVPKHTKNTQSHSFPWSTNDKPPEPVISIQGRVLTGDVTTSNNPFSGQAVEENLDAMSTAVTRLKGLATALGQEMEEQNTTLDEIVTKTAQIELNMDAQGKEIQKIIK